MIKKILFLLFIPLIANANVIGVVDIQKVLSKSLAVNDINKQLENKKSVFERSLKTKESVLKTKDEKLQKEVMLLSEDNKNKKIAAFQDEIMSFRKEVSEKEDELKSLYVKSINQFTKNVQEVIANMNAEEKYNFDIIISSDTVLYAKKTLDITDEVIVRVNKKYKIFQISDK